MRAWAIVPARGGSKGIKRKNLELLNGTSLLERAITNAKASGAFEKIIVSSEDAEIQDEARKLGVEVHDRDPELARDESKTEDVFRNVLGSFSTTDQPDLVGCCECTSPFVLPEHIQRSINEIARNDFLETCMTIAQVDHTSHAFNQRYVMEKSVDFVFPFFRAGTRRQTKPTFYKFGNFVVARTSHISSGGNFFCERTGYIEISKLYSINIDEPDDLLLAQCVANYIEKR